MYKLFSTTILSNKSEKGILLIEDTLEEVIEFISSVGDGYYIGELSAEDIGEGKHYDEAPEDWSPDNRYFLDTPSDSYYGYATADEALRDYAQKDESVILEESE